MTPENLIQIGNYIQFPLEDNTYKEYNIDTIKLPKTNDRYYGFPCNNHHYLYSYSYKNVIPLIAKLCNVKFNINDFKKVKHIINNDEKDYDFSYLIPINDFKYTIYGYEFNIKYDCNFDGLMLYNNEYRNGIKDWYTEYHKSYAFPHSCSRVINHTPKYNKILFISGDSQIVPVVAPLSIYFKEIWYFDNRTENNTSFKEKYKDIKFDHVIFSLYDKDLGTYQIKNLN